MGFGVVGKHEIDVVKRRAQTQIFCIRRRTGSSGGEPAAADHRHGRLFLSDAEAADGVAASAVATTAPDAAASSRDSDDAGRERGWWRDRRWRTASAEVSSGGDRTSGSVAVQRELMAGDVDAGEELDGRQRRGSNDAGSGIARQLGRRARVERAGRIGSDGVRERRRRAAGSSVGEQPSTAPARQRRTTRE
ncbi:hypothetical protein Scep_018935 [Stephania cephalantha]|uniref:Uncharacterized protein n=1 Tax=Stephania cephalantha TaxID=152367 RepID=A0AAP0NPB9_9MAGN